MSPDEFMQTDEYKRRAYSYQYKRAVDDLKQDPLTYEGKKYISTVKLHSQVKDDFVAIIVPLQSNLWKFEGSPKKLKFAPTSTKGIVDAVWVNLNDEIEIAIWKKDQVDMRDFDEAMIAGIFMTAWKNRDKS